MFLAGVAHPVERHLAKVEVASSSLVTRSIKKDHTDVWSFFFICGERLEDHNPAVQWTAGHRRSRRRCFLMRCPLDTEATSLVTRSIKKDHTDVWSFFFICGERLEDHNPADRWTQR